MVREEQGLATSSQNVNTSYFKKRYITLVEKLKLKKKKLVIEISIILLIFGAGFLFYNNAAVVTIGNENSTRYTYSDLCKLSKVEGWIGEVIGNIPKTKKETLYYLVITGIKKEILRENNISILRDNAINTVESNTILKGLYGKIKKYMKDDYYSLVIEPMAVDEIFGAFFRTNNPAKKFAEEVHKEALRFGLETASERAKIEVWEMAIAENEKNHHVISEIKALEDRDGDNRVYDKILEFDNSYVLIELKDITEAGIIVNRSIINKTKEHNFLRDKKEEVEIIFGLLSFFSENDLQKIDGSIFHE